MAVTSFFTLASASQGLYKEKGSKFLSFAYPVKTEEDVKEKLASLRKEYYDARHHCYAWMLGAEKKYFRANDDGEPNHSAGDPILGQIRSKNLTNVLIVVVRYFGGTKLGVGGLIAAYKVAAEHALVAGTIIEEEVTMQLEWNFPYASMNEVMRLVKEFDLHLVKHLFDTECKVWVKTRMASKDALMTRLSLLKDLGVPIVVNLEDPS